VVAGWGGSGQGARENEKMTSLEDIGSLIVASMRAPSSGYRVVLMTCIASGVARIDSSTRRSMSRSTALERPPSLASVYKYHFGQGFQFGYTAGEEG
jgi:hypothetical protein